MATADTWPEIQDQARAWIADDPDPSTAAELADLLARATTSLDEIEAARVPGSPLPPEQERLSADVEQARAELEDRFAGTLQFGTAGLRGAIAAGPNRMNRAVVIRAAAGLAGYLNAQLPGAKPAPRVVIGYDARHRSADFARDTAAVMTAAGIEALLLPAPLPTPVLAFAVRHLGAEAGVMVTASHNPPQDNGYKVYLGGRAAGGGAQGSQIVPPADAAIAAEIARVTSVASVPRADSGWTVLGPDVLDAYVASVLTLADPSDAARTRASALKVVLTPLHGVGGAVATRVLAAAGFSDVTLVPEQAEPDPDFPTVAFPNPEEAGAMDYALGLAEAESADLVLALDPDADRCAVAVDDPASRSFRGPDTAAADGWRMLRGDEVGALLGALAAGRIPGAGTFVAGTPDERELVFANSIVSSRLLSQIAQAAGARHEETLTGFKWISRVDGLVFGYEEALGYCVDPAHVRDKDGISAALVIAQLAATLKADGRTLLGVLDDLARDHGLHMTDQLSVRFTDLAQIPATMARLRDNPPATLGGSPVTKVVDLEAGTDAERGGLPPTVGLRLLAEDGTRVIVRPSGTEPKVKCYLEVIVEVGEHASEPKVMSARRHARDRLDAVRRDTEAALGITGS